jgi:hypothetical protein
VSIRAFRRVAGIGEVLRQHRDSTECSFPPSASHVSRSTMRCPHGHKGRNSPGWTRTNNPPVNSRMLCQLSYRGTRSGGPHDSGVQAALGLGQLGDRLPDLEQLSLQIGRFLEVGACEPPPEVALT